MTCDHRVRGQVAHICTMANFPCCPIRFSPESTVLCYFSSCWEHLANQWQSSGLMHQSLVSLLNVPPQQALVLGSLDWVALGCPYCHPGNFLTHSGVPLPTAPAACLLQPRTSDSPMKGKPLLSLRTGECSELRLSGNRTSNRNLKKLKCPGSLCCLHQAGVTVNMPPH